MGISGVPGRYSGMIIGETVPSYEARVGVVGMVGALASGAELWARSKLDEMTSLDANWEALDAAPPNQIAEDLALSVLTSAHSLRPLEPTYVTASVDGGVGIVYRSLGRYSAFECLNSGGIRLLWFGDDGNPHSKKVSLRGVKKALKQVEAIHAPDASYARASQSG